MQPVRKLGFMEARMHLMQQHFRGTTQGALALRIKGEVDPVRLERSLSLLMERYDILRATIREYDDALYFFVGPANGVPLTTVTRGAGETWSDILQRENEKPLNGRDNLWRVVLALPEEPAADDIHDIIIIVHHAIMDGTAADTFIDELLNEYVGGTDEIRSASIELPDDAESRLPSALQMPWSEYQSALKKISPSTSGAQTDAHKQSVPLEKRRTLVHPVEFEEAQCNKIQAFCDEHGLALNSLFSAALICAVKKASPHRSHLGFNTTFSLRRLCRSAEDEVGCFMNVVPTEFPVSDPGCDRTRIAEEHQVELSKAIMMHSKVPREYDLGNMESMIGSLKDIGTFSGDIGYTFGNSRVKTHYGPLEVSQLYATVNRSLGNLSVAAHGVKIATRCYFTLNYTWPLQDTHWATEVTHEFVRTLTHLPVEARAVSGDQ